MDLQEKSAPAGTPPQPALQPDRLARVWRALFVLIVVAITVLAFAAYRQPELLLNLVGLRYCG